jgi:hypothetical protein
MAAEPRVDVELVEPLYELVFSLTSPVASREFIVVFFCVWLFHRQIDPYTIVRVFILEKSPRSFLCAGILNSS